jgi:hypothetical protein
VTDSYDVLIAGAGVAGVLLATRLRNESPDLRIALIEKEPLPGGRLRSSDPGQGFWSYGLNFVSPTLFQNLDLAIKSNPDAEDLGGQQFRRNSKVGVLSAAKIASISTPDLFTAKGARVLGGMAASRDWQNVEDLRASSSQRSDQSFSAAWPGNRKSPAAIVLEQMVSVLGIGDLWTVSTKLLFDKIEEFSSQRMIGDWETPILQMIDRLKDSVDVHFSSQIVGASFEESEKTWIVSTRGGQFCSKRLVITQTPWDALSWLSKKYWPPVLLQFAVKAKPVSVVVLSEILPENSLTALSDLPEVVMIPAEGAQLIVSPTGDLCYQTTIDYEVSLQAPDVVKAVKQLKRARKKMQLAVPDLVGVGDHLALVSVAWSQPPAMTDRRLTTRLVDRQINSQELMFCGDSYGRSGHGDVNLLESLNAVSCRILGKPLADKEEFDIPPDDLTEEYEG